MGWQSGGGRGRGTEMQRRLGKRVDSDGLSLCGAGGKTETAADTKRQDAKREMAVGDER